MTQQQQTWISPTLPPQVIAQYQAVVPDAGERFFAHMEREQGHRHTLQLTTIRQVGAVQLFTFLLSALGIVGGVIVVAMGQAAGIAVAAPAIILLLQAVWQRHKQGKAEEKRQEQLSTQSE